MEFADLLFSKYASPQILIDQLISNGDFFEWVIEFINAENDRQTWEVWLHRIFDKSFDEFRNSVRRNQPDQMDDEQLETTISNSKSILNGFIPD